MSRLAWAAALAAAAVVLSASVAAPAPRCFGAASRDALRPCRNPRLRFSVSPAPRDAVIEPGAPCTPLRRTVPPSVCAFGTASKTSLALVGDSHAEHWLAALEVAARGRRGVSIYRSRCPFTFAEILRAGCTAWNRRIVPWFDAHPSVHTVVVSARASTTVVPAGGADEHTTAIAGYAAAWAALPPSVTRIFVIRDVPYSDLETRQCVDRAVARHRRPGPACAIPRASAMKRRDDAAAAARESTASRVRLIDLTRYMCGPSRCYPVVGGVLVHKDIGHLTRTFSATLGPYLRRAQSASSSPSS